jgi:hypothetical protein
METNQTGTQSSAKSSASTARPARAKTDKSEQDESLSVVADQAVRSVSALYKTVNESLQSQTEARPYVVLGAAAGIGFVIGGGLASPIGQALVRTSLRAFGGPLLQAVLNATTEAVERHTSSAAE